MNASECDGPDLSTILDHVGDAITVHDTSGTLVYANAAAREFGFLVGEPRSNFHAIPGSLALFDDVGNAISSEQLPSRRVVAGDDDSTMTAHVRADQVGGDRWFRVRARPMLDEGGNMQYVVSVWRDITDRRRSEERDRTLAAIVTTSDDAIVSKTLDGIVTSWNPAAERLFGWTAAEMIGTSIARIIPLERREELARILATLRRGEQVDHFETKRVTKDGRLLDISVSISPLIDSSGRVIGASKIARDVTARKREEAAQRLLAGAGAILAAPFDIEETIGAVTRLAIGTFADWVTVHLAMPDGSVNQVGVAHIDPRRVAWAEDLRRRIPYDPDARNGVANVMRTGRSELYPEITEAMIDAATDDVDLRNAVKDVGLRSGMIAPMVARGQTIGAIGFFTSESGRRYDAHDLALAEELARRAGLAIDNARLYAAVQAAEARYHGLFRNSSVGVAVVSGDGLVLDANESALRMLGRTIDELKARGLTWETMTGGREAWTALDATGIWHGETEVTGADGGVIPVEVHASAIDLPEGRVFLVQWLDITARKAAERFEDEFLSDLAHDLSNPLTAARMQTQLLRRRLRREALAAESTDQALAAIETTMSRMARRISELADLARLRLGRHLELRRRPTELGGMLRELLASHQHTTDRHQLRLEMEVPAIRGDWDADRLERVFDNLLSNAIKYSPNGGPIVVKPEYDDSSGHAMVVVTVSDRGVGISAGDLPLVFDRFRRGGNVPTRVAGSGIGLAGARYVIEQHGGTIGLASVEGEGTTVSVRLPLAQSHDETDELRTA
jgi:PAS domain S-box-containing protein